MTVMRHVDDLKILHKDEKAVTKFITDLGEIYDNKLTVTLGKLHSYLDMHFDFTKIGTVQVGMIPYSKEIIDDFPKTIIITAPTPAADDLFTVRSDEEQKILPEEKAQAFHRSTAQFLFLSQRARPDMQTMVSFLTK